jgi:DNA polymerase eta
MSALFNLGKKPRRDDAVRPVVTYRHVLTSQAMTVMNPLRVIAHCDIDAAYAQFEMIRLGIPEDQPVCVQQWWGLIAVNYPARKFGITRHMDVNEAKKRCPHLQTVHVATYRDGDTEPGYWGEGDPKHHKVSLDPYRRESTKILAVFKRLVGDAGEVEKASIDEAYLDQTGLVLQEILKRHPHLNTVPEDAPFALDTPLPLPPPITWDPLSNIFPLRGDNGGNVNAEADGDGYDGLVEEELAGGWEDYALSVGAEIMGRIRAEVKRELGYTCSAVSLFPFTRYRSRAFSRR